MPWVAAVLCWLTPVCIAQLPAPTSSAIPQSSASTAEAAKPIVGAEVPQPVSAKPSKGQVREAEAAYVSGAKKLDADDLDGAEREFVRALGLDRSNRNYAIAISVVRQHRVTELVQQSSKARLACNTQKAQMLLA
jgi:general secretion pathway protein D